jgi:hypothetical protein
VREAKQAQSDRPALKAKPVRPALRASALPGSQDKRGRAARLAPKARSARRVHKERPWSVPLVRSAVKVPQEAKVKLVRREIVALSRQAMSGLKARPVPPAHAARRVLVVAAVS